MDFKQLMALSERNEVRVDNFRGYKKSVPYYYDSLRHAFGFYFNTFITNNSGYAYYAEGLSGRDFRIFKHQVLDEDNTVLTLIAFERFFELFLKDLLARTNKKLILVSTQRLRGGTQELLTQIKEGDFSAKKFEDKPLSITFLEAINRFYGLVDLLKEAPNSNNIIKKFLKVIDEYPFLISAEYKVTFKYLNWYRNRILHNGNKLPSFWLLDYTITQRVVPIVLDFIEVEGKKPDNGFFYFKTVTGIDILKEFNKIKFEFRDLKNKSKLYDTYAKLLKVGHLKELGRANINMNLFVRMNKATYEYNYQDPKGRGVRFALAEKKHPDFKSISECPCCGVNSLTFYQIVDDDIFNPGQKFKIDWVKCYTCDYHLRYDTGEPYLLNLYSKPLFDVEK